MICYPLVTGGQDYCYCDADLESAAWIDFWGSMQIVWKSQVYFDDFIYGKKLSDLQLFCDQILAPTTITELGTNYSCILDTADI